MSSTSQRITAADDDVLVEVGMGVGRVGFDVEQQALIWAMWRRGDAIREMERTLGETLPRIRRYLGESGAMPPIPRQRRVGHLTLVELLSRDPSGLDVAVS